MIFIVFQKPFDVMCEVLIYVVVVLKWTFHN